MAEQRKLHGAGIGAGYFSQFHYEAWGRIPQVEMTAVCDIDASRAAAAGERFGIPRQYAEIREMLDAERPDFLDVITPPESHLEICRAAAERGVHVICQKPLAPTFAEAREIVALCEAAGIRLMVHENFPETASTLPRRISSTGCSTAVRSKRRATSTSRRWPCRRPVTSRPGGVRPSM